MALFFSIADKSEDPVTSDASRKAEAAAVAEFMEAGKGFFAVGDHEDLGARICQHIPRVRSMRRWAKGSTGRQGGSVAPSGTEADRHDTLRSGSDSGTSAASSSRSSSTINPTTCRRRSRPRRTRSGARDGSRARSCTGGRGRNAGTLKFRFRMKASGSAAPRAPLPPARRLSCRNPRPRPLPSSSSTS
jgi:hypothetical protein